RDDLVTGVQTCALPICISTDVRDGVAHLDAWLLRVERFGVGERPHDQIARSSIQGSIDLVGGVRAQEELSSAARGAGVAGVSGRSEERRVGEESGEVGR